jgi:hypothetical protein
MLRNTGEVEGGRVEEEGVGEVGGGREEEEVEKK